MTKAVGLIGFNSISGDNLPEMKDGVYVINLDDKKSKGTFWVLLHMIFTDVLTKYGWVKALQDKKATTFLHGFIETVNKSK